MLEYNSVIPLFEQVKEAIRADIMTGKLKEKEKLPSWINLTAQYGVSVITVRRAVSELSDEGLLEMKQGKGTYVRSPKISREFQKIMSFTEVCKANGLTAGSKVLKRGIVVPNKEILSRLQLPPKSQVVEIIRLRTIEGKPCVVERNHFPIEYEYLLTVYLEDQSLYECLRERVGGVVRGRTYLEICWPNAEEARLLEVELKTPLLRMVGDIYDINNNILHVCTQVGFGEKFRFYIN